MVVTENSWKTCPWRSQIIFVEVELVLSSAALVHGLDDAIETLVVAKPLVNLVGRAQCGKCSRAAQFRTRSRTAPSCFQSFLQTN